MSALQLSNFIDSVIRLSHHFYMSEIEEQKKTPVGKIIGCGCLVLVVIGLLGGAAIFFGITKALKSNAPYREAIAATESNPAAIAALGEPIKPGLIPSGSIHIGDGEGEVNFEIPVSGPKGKGTIHIRGEKPAGSPTWIYDTRELKVEGQREPIPLGK